MQTQTLKRKRITRKAVLAFSTDFNNACNSLGKKLMALLKKTEELKKNCFLNLIKIGGQMKVTKTTNGNQVRNLTFCRSGMWTQAGIHIQRSNSHLNIKINGK